MKPRFSARTARYTAFFALAFVAFEACSNSSTDSASTPTEPPTIALNTPAGTLACDDSLVVSLAITNLQLRPPGVCGTTPNCGSLTVSVLASEDGEPLITPVRAATAQVQLDLSSLVSPATADAPTLDQVHFIKAQLNNDSLAPYAAPDGGMVEDIAPVTLSPASGCGAGNAGSTNGGAAGMAGASNAGASAGGASGEGGAPNTGGMAGASEGGAAGEGGSSAGASG